MVNCKLPSCHGDPINMNARNIYMACRRCPPQKPTVLDHAGTPRFGICFPLLGLELKKNLDSKSMIPAYY